MYLTENRRTQQFNPGGECPHGGRGQEKLSSLGFDIYKFYDHLNKIFISLQNQKEMLDCAAISLSEIKSGDIMRILLVLSVLFPVLSAHASLSEFYIERVECVEPADQQGYCVLFGPLKDRLPPTGEFPSAHQSGDALVVDASELKELYVSGFSEEGLNQALGLGAVDNSETRFFRDSHFINKLKQISPLYFYRDLRTKHVEGISLADVLLTQRAINDQVSE
ncbi:MAG: hypothetical protein AAF202_06500 [Pseudomonadota bacterium]